MFSDLSLERNDTQNIQALDRFVSVPFPCPSVWPLSCRNDEILEARIVSPLLVVMLRTKSKAKSRYSFASWFLPRRDRRETMYTTMLGTTRRRTAREPRYRGIWDSMGVYAYTLMLLLLLLLLLALLLLRVPAASLWKRGECLPWETPRYSTFL